MDLMSKRLATEEQTREDE